MAAQHAFWLLGMPMWHAIWLPSMHPAAWQARVASNGVLVALETELSAGQAAKWPGSKVAGSLTVAGR